MNVSYTRDNVLRCIFAVVLSISSTLVYSQNDTQSIFDKAVEQVYQIRVIDIASGDKYSIGSGFAINATGHLATNFHVISSYVHEPDKYRLEYVAANETVGELTLVAIDVVHDLAITQAHQLSGDYLTIFQDALPKGERIYSMGNPSDLGMTIVEGNYNGLVEYSRYKKNLFSGSLNPGMSGGPALNQHGEVIGINVSKGGEQISFLVPVSHLVVLINSLEKKQEQIDFNLNIKSSLMADQDHFYQEILTTPIQTKQVGSAVILNKLHPSLNCWGHTVDKAERKYEAIHQHCTSQDELYISSDLYVGKFKYVVEYITTEDLNRFQFYNFLQTRFGHRKFNNGYEKEDLTSFTCHDDLVKLDSGSWKTSTCFRKYKKYDGLFDSSMIMASTDYPDKAVIIKTSMSGSSLENAKALYQRIMEEVTWKN